MLPSFSASEAWSELTSGEVSVFMAVPTVYAKLIEESERLFPSEGEREEVKRKLRENIRLMVSGSAGLPKVFF